MWVVVRQAKFDSLFGSHLNVHCSRPYVSGEFNGCIRQRYFLVVPGYRRPRKQDIILNLVLPLMLLSLSSIIFGFLLLAFRSSRFLLTSKSLVIIKRLRDWYRFPFASMISCSSCRTIRKTVVLKVLGSPIVARNSGHPASPTCRFGATSRYDTSSLFCESPP
ncbi:uncharacterized protein EV422DRAFT_233684 [Fimicolochytrium jonesii]|uniref:uncharacterized protein n=1 Tax=Fimicolochytrium jonesii TaxID=1396493 RepID=UPI0022FEE7CD|nr:uncharacterized protein EV422DRAFT_233684 [Fimicolochytrium jonesii]KAI8824796.1 hypothetical protein EV422DRAFT_233684 [Fimicolochytrium jonesii]